MNSAMNKIQGTESGLVMILYDIANSGETIGITSKGSRKQEGVPSLAPFRPGHFSRLAGLLLECR
jgi:hypothetical protein